MARSVLWLHDRFDRALNAILIGNTVVNTGLSVLFTNLFLLTVPLEPGLNSLIASIILTIFVYLFGETLPKQIASKIPNRFARFSVYPLIVFYFLLWPFTIVLRGISLLFQKIFPKKKEPAFTEEDFASVIEQNEDAGLLEKNESEIIQASIEWSDTSVKEVLTPKYRMFAIDAKGLDNATLIEKICGTTYSRIPIYYQKKNRIIGFLMVKSFLAEYLNNPKANFFRFVEKPYIISPRTKLGDLVDGFRLHKTQVALVMQKEEILGLVTMEDVLEELVGDIDEVIALPEEDDE